MSRGARDNQRSRVYAWEARIKDAAAARVAVDAYIKLLAGYAKAVH